MPGATPGSALIPSTWASPRGGAASPPAPTSPLGCWKPSPNIHRGMNHSQTPLCCPKRGQGDSMGLTPAAGTDRGAEEPSPSPSWAAGDTQISSLPSKIWNQGALGATKP